MPLFETTKCSPQKVLTSRPWEEDDLGDDGEDLETAMRSLHGLGGTAGGAGQSKSPEPAPGEVTKRPEVRTGSAHTQLCKHKTRQP